jgi:hypothetical protein
VTHNTSLEPSRDDFFAGARLAGDEDAQVEARGYLDILPDLPYQLGRADKPTYHWRAIYIWLPRCIYEINSYIFRILRK